MWSGIAGRAAGVAALLRNLLPSPSVADGLPLGLCKVVVSNGVIVTGRVRRVADFIEVIEEPGSVADVNRIERRFYPVRNIEQIRDLSEDERAAVLIARAQARRPCRHCGASRCDLKGTSAEDVHVRSPDIADAWCGAWTLGAHKAEWLTPDEALRAAPGVVTCGACLEALKEHRAEEAKRRSEKDDAVLEAIFHPTLAPLGIADEDTQDSAVREPVEP